MDKYTATEQAYKNGCADTKSKILEAMGASLTYANGLEKAVIEEMMKVVENA